MKNYVIYTVLTGGYDNITQPLVVDDRFDYILFSDQHVGETIGVWQVMGIETEQNMNKFCLSRMPKILPHRFLKAYKASLYLDANVQIATDVVYKSFFDLYNDGIEWGGIKHPFGMDCTYREIGDIVRAPWVHDYDVVKWYQTLLNAGFPKHYGMYENNVIFRCHTSAVNDVCERWWNTIVNGCKRDQFSLMFLLWQTNIKRCYLLEEDECPRTNSVNFNYYEHNKNKGVSVGLLEHIRYRCARIADPEQLGYPYLFEVVCKYNHPILMMYVWELFAIIVYGPMVLIEIIKVRLGK